MSAWSGRKLHFIGIGGAGMSGLAVVCAGLGAEVTGSDRSESSYMERLRAAGLEPSIGHDAANLPEGAEVVVSTAIGVENPELSLARERGQKVVHRGELLAELCAEKRLIAIAGTHGKTTTTAMAVWALRGLGEDPAFFVGGEVPGLGPDGAPANAGWGESEWVVAEADESDGSFLRLDPEIAVVTNVEMDHHSKWGSLEPLIEAFSGFAGKARVAVLPAPTREGGAVEEVRAALEGVAEFSADAPGPERLELAVPGAHNVSNARACLAALGAAGFDLDRAAAALLDFRGVRRRLEVKGERGGVRIYDDYAHHPTEVRAALSALRELDPPRLVAVFQPHLYSRTKVFATQFGAALALADEIAVLDVYPAREEPVGPLAGVSGLDVARAAADSGHGKPVAWLLTAAKAEAFLRRRIEALPPGSFLVTVGAGDVFKLGEALVGGCPGDPERSSPQFVGEGSSELPPGIERNYPLARLTTVRTGGPADYFARPETAEDLVALLAWAKKTGVEVGVVGSGSNLLVADDGFRGLAMKLGGALTEIERDGDHLRCGGGARLPSAAAKAAGWGLSGLEFGINIPGTAGGAVRMNANAYGGQLAEVLEWVEVSTASGTERRDPGAFDFVYRSSNLSEGEVVSRASFSLTPADPDDVRATLASMRGRRREAQPSGIKTFGSTFKNPDDERAEGRSAGQLLEAAGCRGLEHGGARFSEQHANFVENTGEATTADVLALMAEGRRRVKERFGVELEPEVQVLGDVEVPGCTS
ncbi:MAG TPA: UDP-N-acetylmuramate--L-alanine ligase [Solirubrobacterales bacterium]|jgi:UDP-N-acetylmuramate--alanine ligase|nr:UDP-N-acetylmuramate--L-alanine ligase [Solirubrobacterales bacterium]